MSKHQIISRTQHEGACSRGTPPRHGCCVQAPDYIWDPARGGVLEGGGPGGGLSPPGTAAVSKHQTVTFVFVLKITLPRRNLASCALGGGRSVPELAHLCNTSASERLAARTFKLERSKVCRNCVPHRRLGWTQNGSSFQCAQTRPSLKFTLNIAAGLSGQKFKTSKVCIYTQNHPSAKKYSFFVPWKAGGPSPN